VLGHPNFKSEKFQIPTSNIQEKLPIPSSCPEPWLFKFGIFLDVGGWNLEFN
jgi:hypothetical protein